MPMNWQIWYVFEIMLNSVTFATFHLRQVNVTLLQLYNNFTSVHIQLLSCESRKLYKLLKIVIFGEFLNTNSRFSDHCWYTHNFCPPLFFPRHCRKEDAQPKGSRQYAGAERSFLTRESGFICQTSGYNTDILNCESTVLFNLGEQNEGDLLI